MSSFPGSPRLLKGGLVLLDAQSGTVLRMIPLQYNPDTLTRSLLIKGLGKECGDRLETLRASRPRVETIKVEVEVDAIDQRNLQACVTTELTRLLNSSGLAPNLVEGIAVPRISTSCIQMTGNNPMQFGRQLAQSANGAIGGHE